MKKESHKIILKPLLTEKGTAVAESQNTYLFEVHPSVNKIQIKDAIEDLFENVHVVKVTTVNCKGKSRRVRFKEGRTKNWKKAYVTLAQGDKIDMI